MNAPAPARPRLFAAVLAFVVVYIGARAALEHLPAAEPLALAVALAPVLAFAAVIVQCVRAVRRMDELARRIQLEALALAFPCALLVTFAAGLLELAGFQAAGDFDLPRLWPLLLAPYWIGFALAQRRYS